MEHFSEVIVIGGGPSGSFTALNLAKQGVTVNVFEEHSEIGQPSHCAGHVGIKSLKWLKLFPLPDNIVENVMYGATFYSPKGKEFSIKSSAPVTLVVNRTLFDKYLAKKAQKEGARYTLKSKVKSLIIKDKFVKGVIVKNGKEEKCKIVVDAEGIGSRLLKQTALQPFSREMLRHAIQVKVEKVKDLTLETVEIFLGEKYAPGFFAWMIPLQNGIAKIGLASKTGNADKLLKKLFTKHPIASKKLRNANILEKSMHPITVGGPITKSYLNGLIVVGDAASQVKATTGGGLVFGMSCSEIAATVIKNAIVNNDWTEQSLGKYQEKCDKLWKANSQTMVKSRKIIDKISDRGIEKIISFYSKIGLNKTLQKIEDIDFQRNVLSKIMLDPRVSIAIIYFLWQYINY